MAKKYWNDDKFIEIITDDEYSLPIESSSINYENKLENLLNDYTNNMSILLTKTEQRTLETICKKINTAVKSYHQGFPSDAYKTLCDLMRNLSNMPLGVLEKSNLRMPNIKDSDPLQLYRMVSPFKDKDKEYTRKDLFHLPYYLRKKASSCRYSIAGYPSLYLGTSVELCSSETHLSAGWVSKYKLNRNQGEIKVYDLAIRPLDFKQEEKVEEILYWTNINIREEKIKKNYTFWYPFIAACSFIRREEDKKEKFFASEYIIPQLFMQWLRKQATAGQLFGVRYFSCNSKDDSEKGYNYVLPVSGKRYKDTEYCDILANSFTLSTPFYVERINECKFCITNIETLDFKAI